MDYKKTDTVKITDNGLGSLRLTLNKTFAQAHSLKAGDLVNIQVEKINVTGKKK